MTAKLFQKNISFFEQIKFTGLSENKLKDFLSNFDINLITNTLCHKICQSSFNKLYQNSVKSERIQFLNMMKIKLIDLKEYPEKSVEMYKESADQNHVHSQSKYAFIQIILLIV